MNPKVMIWISVLLMGFLQIVLKFGMTRVAGFPVEVRRNPVRLAIRTLSEAWLWTWGLLFLASMVLWLVGLRTVDLSYAYPLASVGYVMVGFLAIVVLKEKVPVMRWVAVCVICAGIWMIAGS